MILLAKLCACSEQKFGEGVISRGQKIGFFSRATLLAMCHNKQIGHCSGIGQAIGAHTGAGGQCALHG